MKRFYSLVLTLGALLGVGCIPRLTKPPLKPEEIPNFAFKNLKRQRSFAFDYRLEQQQPVAVKQSATGIYILPDQEEVSGRWAYQDGTSVPFHIIGWGDKEYQKTETDWDVHSRGEETDLLVQIDRTHALGKFKLLKEKPDYEFEFTPNVPFLDPTFTKKIKGSLVINRQLLPKRIAAWDEKGTASWQVDFKNYNQPERVNLPFVKQKRVLFATADPRAVINQLRQRFLTLGMDAKVTIQGTAIEAVFAQEVQAELLNNLIAPGKLEIAPVRWLEAASDTGKGAPTYQGRPVAIDKTVLTNLDLTGARVNFDPLGRPVLELILNHAGEQKYLALSKANLKHHYGVILDGKIVTISYIDKIPSSPIISVTDLPTYKDALMIEAVINSGVFTQTVTLIEKGE